MSVVIMDFSPGDVVVIKNEEAAEEAVGKEDIGSLELGLQIVEPTKE